MLRTAAATTRTACDRWSRSRTFSNGLLPHAEQVTERTEDPATSHLAADGGKKTSLGQCFEASPFQVEPIKEPLESSLGSPYQRWVAKIPHNLLLRKIVAEMISTFCLVFSGCGAAVVNSGASTHGVITQLGIATAFGVVVTIMIYSVGHISGAHMNPAVTIAFATVRHFPWGEVPIYIGAQCSGSICAAYALRLIFGNVGKLGATVPAGSVGQSFALEVIITFILMFVVAAVATDTRAVGEMAGIAVGATVALNALFAGPISGASMNPARSIGPAIAGNTFTSIWIYLLAPTLGALLGCWAYALIRGPKPSAADMERLKESSTFKR
ncbi:hypothetical protein R1flu_027204 [Riccia fluitans]|uniref:Uncharacterized protein n=1 Tax=Riccia fluitans TaxID=41844 RepID=A0ABD1XI77_9MARC